MDYTLAPYRQRAIDALSIEKTVSKLIERCGYPDEIRDVHLDHDFIIRGLMVDKEAGNICKLDTHRHVGRTYHGYRPVSKDERRALYRGKPINFAGDRFAWVDTLFSLPEATLLAGIIEHYEGNDRTLPWSYRQLFDDIRNCIDEAHRDNSMKEVILADLPQFFERDPDLAPTLHKLKSAGRKLFLLTNSEWHYTEAVMSYLLDDALPYYGRWRNYFDLIVASSRKPTFFTGDAPFVEIDDDGHEVGVATSLESGRFYLGGNLREFERITGLVGDSVMYVGDHIYGDILRTKKESAWRSALVIQEMEAIVHITHEQRPSLDRIHALELAARRLDHDINHHQMLIKGLSRWDAGGPMTGPEARAIEATRERASEQLAHERALLEQTLDEVRALEDSVEAIYNPFWGDIFRERNGRSCFAGQVEEYADVYTSRVSNFLAYSPVQYFRVARKLMPHERAL